MRSWEPEWASGIRELQEFQMLHEETKEMIILGPGHCPGGPELSGTSGTSRTSRTGTGTTLRSRACFDFASDCVRWFVLSASKVVSFVPDVPGGSRAVVRDVRGSSRFVVRDVPGGCRLVVRDVPSCCRGFDSVIGQCGQQISVALPYLLRCLNYRRRTRPHLR